MRFQFLIAVLVAAISIPGNVNAGIVYQYVTDAVSYAPKFGENAVVVNLYLQETVSGGSSSIIGPGTAAGLSSVIIGVNRTNGGSSTISNAAGNASFSNSFTSVQVVNGGANAGFAMFAPNGSGNGVHASIAVAAGVNRVLIGSLTIAVNGASPTSFEVVSGNFAASGTAAADNGDGTLTIPGGLDLDASFYPTAVNPLYNGTSFLPVSEFTVNDTTAVPEPGAFALCGLALASYVAKVVRKQHSRRTNVGVGADAL